MNGCREATKILILAPNWLGDCVMASGALEDGEEPEPGFESDECELHVFARPPWTRIFEDRPNVFVHAYDRHRLLRFQKALSHRGRGFSACAVLQPSISAGIVACLSGAPIRVGEAVSGRGALLSHGLPAMNRNQHLSSYYARILRWTRQLVRNSKAAPPGWLPPPLPALQARAAERQLADALLLQHGVPPGERLLVFACDAEFGPAKRYPVDAYAELAARLERRLGCTSVLIGTRPDPDLRLQFQKRTARWIDLQGQTSFPQLLGILSRAAGVLANDSGPMHLAAALGVPTLGIFGSTNPLWTAPGGLRASYTHHPVWCSPCYQRKCTEDFACMTKQTPELVEEKFLTIAGLGATPSPAAPL